MKKRKKISREELREFYNIVPDGSGILEIVFRKYGPLYKLKDGAVGYLGMEIPEEQLYEVFLFLMKEIRKWAHEQIKLYKEGANG